MLNKDYERQQLKVVTPRNFAIHRQRVTIDGQGCWIYRLPESTRGRPRITVSGVDMEAYRFFWLAYTRTPVPEGMQLLHSCDRGEEGCVNPQHLRIGTHLENMQDKTQRKRQRNQHTGRTHCVNGHELTEENVYIKPRDGSRECRTCRAASKKRHSQKSQGTESGSESSTPSTNASSAQDATKSPSPPTATQGSTSPDTKPESPRTSPPLSEPTGSATSPET